jgi:K+-sensing histidine kinase KdpD
MIKMQASCVSHDMRAPLSAISHVMDEVLRKKGIPKKLVNLLKPVRCAAKILHVQVYNLLDYNLLQKNKFKANLQKVDIRELLEMITEAMSPQAEMRRVKMSVKVSPDLPRFF